MKTKLSDLYKGFLIGLIVTIPGFSIGTLAIILNIYERLINDFSDMVKHPWKVIKKDLFLGIGFIVGFVLDVILVAYLLEHFPMQTVCFFVGLVLASIPQIVQNGMNAKLDSLDQKQLNANYKQKKFNYLGEIIVAAITFGALIGITMLNAGNSRNVDLSVGFLLAMLLSGIIGAGFMIIPGISGSLIVLALGYYDSILTALKGMGNCIVSGNFTNFWTYLISSIVFIIGALIGLIGVSKILKKLLEKVASLVYFGILGLLIGSPFAIVYLTATKYSVNWNSAWTYIISFIMVALGFVAGIIASKFENKNNQTTNQDGINKNETNKD